MSVTGTSRYLAPELLRLLADWKKPDAGEHLSLRADCPSCDKVRKSWYPVCPACAAEALRALAAELLSARAACQCANCGARFADDGERASGTLVVDAPTCPECGSIGLSLAQQRQRGAAEEREACARLAEAESAERSEFGGRRIAKLIRARGAPPAPPRHELKTWPEPFESVWSGAKKHEFRRADRAFAVGDVLELREVRPLTPTRIEEYTGRKILARVTYVGRGFGIPEEYVVMSIDVVERVS